MRDPLLSRRTTGFAACILVLSASAAHAESFDAKPGAWEMTTTMTGVTIPPEALARMPPERRAMIEKRMADGRAPDVRKSCVKKEDLDQDRFMQSTDASCTVKTVSRTSTKLVMATTCTGERASTGTMTFEAKSPESVVGSIDQERGDGSKFHIGIVGRWLGASCAGIAALPGAKK